MARAATRRFFNAQEAEKAGVTFSKYQTAQILAANVQVLCPHCKEVVGTEGGCAHWSWGLYSRTYAAQCGTCGLWLYLPPLPLPGGELDPKEQLPEEE
jgi:hypothetical protein